MSRFAEAAGSCAATRHRLRRTSSLLATGSCRTRPARTVTLSAWADCTADGEQDDAYLTFYRRPTVPANDTERLACTGVDLPRASRVERQLEPRVRRELVVPWPHEGQRRRPHARAPARRPSSTSSRTSDTSPTYTAPPTVRVKPE